MIMSDGHAAQSTSVKPLAMIPVPGEAIESYDIGIVDENTHLYYQTDRSNKSVDIFDVTKSTFVGRVPQAAKDIKDLITNSSSQVQEGWGW
jgi:hypothetical protein